MKSIIQSKKECFECMSYSNLEIHHIFFGSANRKLSEQDGLKVWLCPYHHRGTKGVHRQRWSYIRYVFEKCSSNGLYEKIRQNKRRFYKKIWKELFIENGGIEKWIF